MYNPLLITVTLALWTTSAVAAEGAFLKPANGLSLDLVRTAISLQRHTEFVSGTSIKAVESAIKRSGFTQVGTIITGGRGSGLQAYVATRGDKIVVAFRGTKSSKLRQFASNIATDLKARKKKIDFAKAYKKIKVHRGFLKDYGKVRKGILSRLKKHPNKKIYVTGFSLGAALATLCSLDIKANLKRSVVGYYLASPRVGGADFRKAFAKAVPKAFRVTLNRDVVSRVPGLVANYEHVGRLLQLYPNGVRVPAKKIETKISNGSFSFHDRNKYKKALTLLRKSCEKSASKCSGSGGPLKKAAKAERKA